MDFRIAKVGVIFMGIFMCVLLAMGLPVAIDGNWGGILIVGAGMLALFQTMRLQNSLKMARSLHAQDGTIPTSTDEDLRLKREDTGSLVIGEENRYSTDGTYEFTWNRKFPVDCDMFWPSGKLLQLQRLAGSSQFIEKNHIIFLFPEELVIGEQADPELNPPWGEKDWSFYRFYSGKVIRKQSYDVSCIDRVELELSWVTSGIAIWIRNEQGLTKRVFKAGEVGIPKTINELADECIRQGIARPSSKLTKAKELSQFRRQLLHRMIETQFRKCAPSAEINLAGEQMPEEAFRRIVK